MATALATIEELEVRAGFELDDRTRGMAIAALDDASALVREFGDPAWTPDIAPPIAKSLTLAAALRYVHNPMAVTQSRGGVETLAWDASAARGVYLLPEEVAVLERHAQQARGLHVAELVAYSDSTIRQRTRQIPVDYGGKFWPDYRPGDTYGARSLRAGRPRRW